MTYLTNRIVIICVIFLYNTIHSQDSIPSIHQIRYIDSLSEIAKKDLIGNGDLLKKLLTLSREVNYPKGELQNLVNLGIYYTNNSMIDSANVVYEKGENLIKKHQDLEFILPHIYNNKANILTHQAFHYQALKYYHKTLEINLRQKDRKTAIITKMNILNCHLKLGEPDKVLAYSKELLENRDVIEQEGLRYRLYSSLALAHFDKKEYGKAINWWNANLESIQNSDKKGEISYIMTSIADAYRSLGNHEIALEKSIEAKKIIHNKPELSSYAAINSLVLGKIYNSLDNPKEAIIHFNNAILQNPDDPMDIAFAYESLGAIYKKTNNWKASSNYYQKYGSLIDSLYNKRNEDISKISEGKIQLIEEEYKNELLTRDNDILSYKNEKQRLYIISLYIGLFSFLLFLLSFALYKKYHRSEKQIELLKENEKNILEKHIQSKEEEFLATMISVNEKLNKLSTIKKYLSSAIKYNNHDEILEAEKRLSQFISSTSDLGILKNRIESQYPGITAQINAHYPDLSTNDIRHCLLIKLNLSIKESAQLLGVSVHAVKMARKRVKKKISIPEDVSLKEHLRDIVEATV
ncbi:MULTISPECIES: tetratricopeptide repeat protein [Aquimarina]|uniref:Tetratricopeptide repeat protein n=1 Tax=Aquimarina algiphila TaxID=2047982 RepID=A0A554VMD6_9FLAO|nr:MULTISPECIES: tetratricopeptide repeat protein [Aquimarina]TSE09393.1 tetratricopeptide repeat protein [Aquimarina algiphila]